MSPSTLSPAAAAELEKTVQRSCADRENDLPCAQVVIVGDGRRNASNLFEFGVSQTGDTGPNDTKNVSNDIYWLASCTKLVTAIACMQLVEQGLLNLDDADQLTSFCHELGKTKVVGENGNLENQKTPITLRMLLTHTGDYTAGFGYSFLNPKLNRAYDEFSGQEEDFNQPLVNQPGEKFEYGISLDWAGRAVERVTRQRLNDYIQQNVFEPLGVKNITMLPSPVLKRNMAGIWQRGVQGRLTPREYPLNKPLNTDTEPEDLFNSGGAGLFGSVKEFSKILTMLLNNGRSPTTGRQILNPETVEEMFTNQIPHQPDFARRALPAVKPDLTHPAPGFYPLCESLPQGWGLSFMISPSITGRSDTTVQWSGLSNVFWWCDREKGLGGIVGSQVLPFVDLKVTELWTKVEQRVYEALS